jgi:hypothetical protein
MRVKGRRLVLATGTAAVALMVLAGFLLRESALELWHLGKLRQGNAEEKRAAIEHLGLLRSEKAAPIIVEEMRRLVKSSNFSLSFFMTDHDEAYLKRSIVRIGSACDPYLVQASLDQSPSVSALAATCLEEIHGYGPERYGMPRFEMLFPPPDCVHQDIGPVLGTLAEDSSVDPKVRRAATAALRKVQDDRKSVLAH